MKCAIALLKSIRNPLEPAECAAPVDRLSRGGLVWFISHGNGAVYA